VTQFSHLTGAGEVSGTLADARVVLSLAKSARSKLTLANGAKLAATKKIMQDTVRRWTAKIQPTNIRIYAKLEPTHRGLTAAGLHSHGLLQPGRS
jgi:hypothetical protein